MPFFGEVIALLTVLFWTVSVQFFEVASKRVGPTPVNIIRIGIAVFLFGAFLTFRDGMPIPLDFPPHAWLYLSLSGVIGFFLGDIYLFKALVELGPRVAMLLHSLAAPTAAVLGWIFLDEVYVYHQWLGIMVTLFGIGLVILEKHETGYTPKNRVNRKITLIGVIYGLLAMFGQGAGMVLSKAGMQIDGGYLDAFAATQIRATAAFICFALFFTVTQRWVSVRQALADRKAVLHITLGSIMGPFLGVSLALLALHYLSSGVASTIFSLVPICMIPFAIFLHKEHVSLRAVIGAVIAVFGIFLLTS